MRERHNELTERVENLLGCLEVVGEANATGKAIPQAQHRAVTTSATTAFDALTDAAEKLLDLATAVLATATVTPKRRD